MKKLYVIRLSVEERERCVLEGLDAALGRKKRSRERSVVLDGEAQAQLVAIACSEPPAGRSRWTLHLLRDELQRRKIVASVSHETVRKVLKKRCQTLAPGDVVHPAATGAPFAGETRIRVYAQARQLAEHGRMRIQRACASVPESPGSRSGRGERGGQRPGETPE